MRETREMTVREMVLDIQEATSKMSVNNPHRRLLLRCAHALVQLAKRATPEKADATESEVSHPAV